jgi:transcriptional regulator with XRE-family HTH domain
MTVDVLCSPRLLFRLFGYRLRMSKENLAQSLRFLRESRHVSLRTSAEQPDYSASFLSQVENGQVSPSIASMERSSTALGVTLAQFSTTLREDKVKLSAATTAPG